jgi:two-component system NtrC family response regulator
MGSILIIDDDLFIRDVLADNAENLGHETHTAGTLSEGLDLLETRSVDLVFLDVRLPDGNGLDALPAIRKHEAFPEVIIITGVGDVAGAEVAFNAGAWDYIQKPFSKQEILHQLKRVFEYRAHRTGTENRTVSLKRSEIIGASAPLTACLDRIAQCADTDANVLITGETGTGKELFAKAIHDNSARWDKRFMVVDCAALPEQLVESVLFGHEKGAFTGADRTRGGLIYEANEGTLFLDEIGELPLAVQKSFLRVLQERRFRPVGARSERLSDFRLVVATNRNLDRMASEGNFRSDLLFRIRTFSIELPPLRNRPEDIRELTLHYIYRICKKRQLEMKGMAPEFIECLSAYHWPGNVRELISAIEMAVICDPKNPVLYPMHLPVHIRVGHIKKSMERNPIDSKEVCTTPPHPTSTPDPLPADLPHLKTYREAVIEREERRYLARLMETAEGNIDDACAISGLSQSRLYHLLKKHGISRQ